MPAEDDRGLRAEKHQEDTVDEQHRGQPLVAVRDGPRRAGPRLDAGRVQGEVRRRQHHAAHRNGDERPQHERVELQVRDDRARPLREDRVGRGEQQSEDDNTQQRPHDGAQRRRAVPLAGDTAHGATEPREPTQPGERPGDAGQHEGGQGAAAHEPGHAERTAGQEAQDHDPLGVPDDDGRRQERAQRGTGQGEGGPAVDAVAEDHASARQQHRERAETEVPERQHQAGEQADAEAGQDCAHVPGNAGVGPEPAEQRVHSRLGHPGHRGCGEGGAPGPGSS